MFKYTGIIQVAKPVTVEVRGFASFHPTIITFYPTTIAMLLLTSAVRGVVSHRGVTVDVDLRISGQNSTCAYTSLGLVVGISHSAFHVSDIIARDAPTPYRGCPTVRTCA